MNSQLSRNDQPTKSGSPEENAAELDDWEQLTEKVRVSSPARKEAWYGLRLMPGGPQSSAGPKQRQDISR